MKSLRPAARSRALFALPVLLVGCADAAEIAAPPRSPDRVVVREYDPDLVGVSITPPVRRAPPEFHDTDPEAVRLFYDVLAPFGTWSDDARLGLVWTPARESVGDYFVPYSTHGRWTHRRVAVHTSSVDEYIWASELPWGWVAFHYGRWAYTGDQGWAWIPGRKYAGAWVDWRVPAAADADAVVGWGPMPPSHVWRVAPGLRLSRATGEAFDPREAHLVAIPFSAFVTPYSYARARDLFAHDLSSRVLSGSAALAVAHATDPAPAPSPSLLGFRPEDVPGPPLMDRGLQQAWMLATPASAIAVGRGPELAGPPRLRTWVAGGPRWATLH
jgi:hypothetical protein